MRKSKRNLLIEKLPQLIGAPLPGQMHYALAQLAIAAVVIGHHLRHQHVLLRALRSAVAPVPARRPRRLLRLLRSGVPRVVGPQPQLLLAVRVPALGAMAAGPGVAPEVGAEAGFPQRGKRRMIGAVAFGLSLAFLARNRIAAVGRCGCGCGGGMRIRRRSEVGLRGGIVAVERRQRVFAAGGAQGIGRRHFVVGRCRHESWSFCLACDARLWSWYRVVAR